MIKTLVATECLITDGERVWETGRWADKPPGALTKETLKEWDGWIKEAWDAYHDKKIPSTALFNPENEIAIWDQGTFYSLFRESGNFYNADSVRVGDLETLGTAIKNIMEAEKKAKEDAPVKYWLDEHFPLSEETLKILKPTVPPGQILRIKPPEVPIETHWPASFSMDPHWGMKPEDMKKEPIKLKEPTVEYSKEILEKAAELHEAEEAQKKAEEEARQAQLVENTYGPWEPEQWAVETKYGTVFVRVSLPCGEHLVRFDVDWGKDDLSFSQDIRMLALFGDVLYDRLKDPTHIENLIETQELM